MALAASDATDFDASLAKSVSQFDDTFGNRNPLSLWITLWVTCFHGPQTPENYGFATSCLIFVQKKTIEKQ